MAALSITPDNTAINMDRMKKMLDECLPITQIARAFIVSRFTIYRHMKKHGLVRVPFSDISDDDLFTVWFS